MTYCINPPLHLALEGFFISNIPLQGDNLIVIPLTRVGECS